MTERLQIKDVDDLVKDLGKPDNPAVSDLDPELRVRMLGTLFLIRRKVAELRSTDPLREDQ